MKKFVKNIITTFFLIMTEGHASNLLQDEVQEIKNTICLSKIPNTEFEGPFNTVFNDLVESVEESTGCKNPEFSFIHWLKEPKRKFNYEIWHTFEKLGIAIHPGDRDMVSASLQIKSISVLLYRDFKYKTETEIDDLKKIALSEDRARVELIRNLAIPVQSSTLSFMGPFINFGNGTNSFWTSN